MTYSSIPHGFVVFDFRLGLIGFSLIFRRPVTADFVCIIYLVASDTYGLWH